MFRYVFWVCLDWMCNGCNEVGSRIYELCMFYALCFLNNFQATLSMYRYKSSNEVKCSKPIQSAPENPEIFRYISLFLFFELST